MELIISKGSLTGESLAGKTAIVTGAGGGIGYEAARALLWLGARVVIAEINKKRAKAAEECLAREFGDRRVLFVPTDVGDAASVRRLAQKVCAWSGKVDIIINNATIAPLGSVKDIAIDVWDASYGVNLRGPVLMAQTFLPDMIARGEGVFICVTSKGSGYMGAYETFKAGQEHLAVTLADELAGSGVSIFTIGPGFSPTATADSSIPRLAAMMGLEEVELRKAVAPQVISVEAAGAGFAAAAALAEQFHGMEIASLQALHAAGIEAPSERRGTELEEVRYSEAELEEIRSLSVQVRDTLAEQSAGWKQRSIFEQQWLVRSFKKTAGASSEEWLARLDAIQRAAAQPGGAALGQLPFRLKDLAAYYNFLARSAEGYVKDPIEREKQINIVRGWQSEVEELDGLIQSKRS